MWSKNKEYSCLEDELFLKEALLKKRRILVYESPRCLKEIAGYAVVCDIWRCQRVGKSAKRMIDADRADMPEEYYDQNYGGYWGEERFVLIDMMRTKIMECINRLPIPKTLILYLKSGLDATYRGLKFWSRYQRRQVFFDYANRDVAYKYADHVVWRNGGIIDYAETAKNMVKFCDELENVEKFRLMSVYCLEDEILDRLPSLSKRDDLERGALRDAHPLIYYWRSYVKGELNDTSDTMRTITSSEVNNLHAIRYLWSKLEKTKRIEAAEHLIRNHDEKYQAFVLSELNEFEQRQMFTRLPKEVFCNFMIGCNLNFIGNDLREPTFSTVESAFCVFLYIKDFLTERLFVKIVEMLLLNASYFKCPAYYELLCKIWDYCPDHLKKFALNCVNLQLLERITQYKVVISAPPQIMVFLMKVLSDADKHAKNNLLSSPREPNFWLGVLLRTTTRPLFHKLVSICGGNEECANSIKNQALHSQKIERCCFYSLIQFGPKELDEFLSVYFVDRRSIVGYKVRLLTSDEVVRHFVLNPHAWTMDWNKIIDDISPNPDTAYKYKQELVFSETTWEEMLLNIPLSVDRVRKFCSNLLRIEDEKKLKGKFLLHYCSRPYSEIFHLFTSRSWNDFLLWAMDGVENVRNFKLSLPIDKIFVELLKDAIFRPYHHLRSKCKFRFKCFFAHLNKFLYWYCDSIVDAKLFKLRKLYELQDIDVIDKLVEAKDQSYFGQVLGWFFSGDKKEIERFAKRFPSSEISSVASICHMYRQYP